MNEHPALVVTNLKDQQKKFKDFVADYIIKEHVLAESNWKNLQTRDTDKLSGLADFLAITEDGIKEGATIIARGNITDEEIQHLLEIHRALHPIGVAMNQAYENKLLLVDLNCLLVSPLKGMYIIFYLVHLPPFPPDPSPIHSR